LNTVLFSEYHYSSTPSKGAIARREPLREKDKPTTPNINCVRATMQIINVFRDRQKLPTQDLEGYSIYTRGIEHRPLFRMPEFGHPL